MNVSIRHSKAPRAGARNIPSFPSNISMSSQRYKDILEVTGGRLVPEWLDVDQEALKGTVKEVPARDAIDVPVNEMLIVELYSK